MNTKESSEPRAITPEELRDQLLGHMRQMAKYWAEVDSDRHHTILDRINGFGHSVLAMLDGESIGLPAFDLVAKPHEDDKQYQIDNEENWIEDETRISDTLHDHWYK